MEIARKIKLKQTIIVISLMLTVFLLVHLFSHWLKKETIVHPKPQKINLPNAANADLQSIWVQKLERKYKEQNEALKEATAKVEQQQSAMTELKESVTQDLKKLHEKIDAQPKASVKLDSVAPPSVSANLAVNPYAPTLLSSEFQRHTPPPAIISHSFKLVDSKKPKNKETYIPAGTIAEAVILGGIDAAAGVTAQSDPKPLLLRLVNLSILPNRVRKDIQDCHVIASGYGEISSERAIIRTERLSCVFKNGEVFEQKIEAYVAGNDGMDGVRGEVVRREGNLIFNSFLAGTLSGMGKGMSQSLGTVATSPLGATRSLTGQDVLKSGVYSGAGEGSEQLQKYFIQRAEQIQPIIQIPAGQAVSIIFLKGVDLDVPKIH